MIKETPNPPKPASTFPYGDYAPEKLQEAADRALDHYLKPDDSESDPKPSVQLFTVSDSVDTEALLANPAKPWLRPMRCSATWRLAWKARGGM